MGHDISAFKVKLPDSSTEREEVAYIRFAMWNTVGQYLFYESLNAQKFNNGVSGSFDSETYSLEEIKKAKEKLNYIVGDSDIIEQILNYSAEEDKSEFKEILKQTLSNLPHLDEEQIKERFECTVREINEFYNFIISSKEEVVEISFM